MGPPAARCAPHNVMPGNPRGRAFRCICSGSGGGRRRAIGVVAVLQSSPARPRRWCDAGPPKADQKAGTPGRYANADPTPTHRRSPLPLGYVIPTAARLMGRRDARPYNGDAGVAGGGPEGRGSRTSGDAADDQPTGYRWTRAEPPFAKVSTSGSLAMVTSPGNVVDRAPWAQPRRTTSSSSRPSSIP